jgi:class 3 adenylate cyclase
LNLNSILIGSEDPQRLVDYYSRLFGKPTWDEGGYAGWLIGAGGITVGPHDQVRGANTQPGRLIWNIETSDVKGDFERLRAAGATVIQEPYNPAAVEADVGIATFADPDDNYFQLVSPMYAETLAWAEEQVGSLQAAQNTDRVLASVLFTDIVDSSGRAATLGDRRWRQLLDRHDRAARAEVERFHGRFVKATGDGLLATFDAPTRALRCAFGLIRTLADVGLDIRTAVHTGEIEILEEDVGGIGVHIAARALGEAGARQVIVTRTVRELATGTDLVFESLGSVGLRGIPGEWELFQVSTKG